MWRSAAAETATRRHPAGIFCCAAPRAKRSSREVTRVGASVCGMLARKRMLGAATTTLAIGVAFALPVTTTSEATTRPAPALTPQAEAEANLHALESRYFEVAPTQTVIPAVSG